MLKPFPFALVAFVAVALTAPAVTHAGPSAATKCQAAKLKAAGKGCACRHAAAAKAVANGGTPDFTKCTAKLGDAFAKADAKGGCPTTGEGTGVDGRLAGLVGDLETALQTGTASGDDAIACAAAKLKAAGKKCDCIHKTQATATIKGSTPDFSKCDAKLDAAFAKAETKAAGMCPTISDAETVCDDVQASFAEIEADIADRDTDSFSAPGPYGVGLRTVTLVDSTRPTMENGTYPGAPDRTLITNIWYPIAPSETGSQQIINAPIVPTGGPFPLIVRAHGYSGFRGDSVYITRQLASRGYIVVEPDFPLSHLGAPGGVTLADVGEQAKDLSFLIDNYVAENGNPSSFLSGRIDTTRIGAVGHSLGGATVLLATYHPDLKDARIDATVALSPLACVFLDGYFDNAAVPLMIESGTVDMITPPTSNHLTPYGYVNAPKYLLSFAGGTHLGFSDRIAFDANENGDDAVGCGLFVQPGDPRPVTIDPGLPPDYLGGTAKGVDPSGSMCEPICPNPPASFMLHARQNTLAKAATTAFFDAKLRDSVSGHRMITGRLDADNADATLAFEE